jgi:hypothetical protein
MDGLAGLYMSQGKYDKAEPLYVESLAKRKTLLGDYNPNRLDSMNNLAGAYGIRYFSKNL